MKISIVGAGRVGSATAFALLATGKIDELVLVDKIKNLAEGEALDLGHATVALSPKTKIIGTEDISAVKDSKAIIITAGKPRNANQTREELTAVNAPIIESICKDISKLAPSSTLVIVTNPSTQMGEIAEKHFQGKVVVMDNQLDTARLKYFLAKETNKLPTDFKSNITGEHGENMKFIINDSVNTEILNKVKKETLEAGKHIISLKGKTEWGIASQIALVVKGLI